MAIERHGVFHLNSHYKPAGDQPNAIAQLTQGLQDGLSEQILLGVTGSGKTFTIANCLAILQRPCLIMAPNKTLAAQLYAEMKQFFPHNSVEYFVSYYDYYQPEAYVPASDLYIEKDASINEQIEQMRLSATKALMERKDAIIVATVSAIYGLGDPKQYLQMILHLVQGQQVSAQDIFHRLAVMQYDRQSLCLERGTFRVRGDVIDIFPAENEQLALRLVLDENLLEDIAWFDPLTSAVKQHVKRATIYPKTHYVTPRHRIVEAMEQIKIDLQERLETLFSNNHILYAERLKQRTLYDLEMMDELGYCNGIENYSRYLSGRLAGEPPPTLFDYLPEDALLVIDESHVTVPQIGGMYRGDRARKMNLVEYGFRLPSALDNRPMQFEEWVARKPQTIYVSATPGQYELDQTTQIVEQLVRPTGLLDPQIEVRAVDTQVDDVTAEISIREKRNERVLITTLTKRNAEQLTDYLQQKGFKVRYMHSDIQTIERVEILRDLRLGIFDVLVGINLLREGLDLPEVSLVAIFDADKEGFLRGTRALIQTIGRAARNEHGLAILYGSKITNSMRIAIDETNRRRQKQHTHNLKYNITPKTIHKSINEYLDVSSVAKQSNHGLQDSDINLAIEDIPKIMKDLNKQIKSHAEKLEFEQAAKLRDRWLMLKSRWLQIGGGQEDLIA